MSRLEHVSQTMRELGAEIGIPQLALDETARASLAFADIPVTLSYTLEPVELLWLFIDMGRIDPSDAATLDGLLQLGFLTWSSSVMTIGLDPAGERACGYASIPVVNLSLAALRGQLDRMLEAAAAIRQRIAQADFDIELAPA